MRPPLFFLLLAMPAAAADTTDKVNSMLQAGAEVGWVVQDSTDARQDLAVLFTSRQKGSQPAAFPTLTGDEVLPRDTSALDEDTHVLENIIVSLKQKKVIGRIVPPVPDAFHVYFPNRNHGSLAVRWLAGHKGRRMALLIYGAKWHSPEVLLIDTSGDSLRQASIKRLLDENTLKFIGGGAVKELKGEPVASYVISYQPVTGAGTPPPGSDGIIKLAFMAEVPKSEIAPSLEGTLTLQLETIAGKPGAKVLKVEPATPQ